MALTRLSSSSSTQRKRTTKSRRSVSLFCRPLFEISIFSPLDQAYSWGYSDEFQLGFLQRNNFRKAPKRVSFLDQEVEGGNIKDIVISDSFCLALTTSGEVWSWGNGSNGHIGKKA
jgi:alpha-tubulin suppressor-like RCC1 family protein